MWSPRAQADKRRYSAWVKERLSTVSNIHWIFAPAHAVVTSGGRVRGVQLEDGRTVTCHSLVITTGTFLNGLVHIGREQRPSGRAGEPPSIHLAESLKSVRIPLGPAEDGHPSSSGPAIDRLLTLPSGER